MKDAELRSLLEAMRQNIREDLRQDIRQEITAVRGEITAVRGEITAVRGEIAAQREENAAAHEETRRLFTVSVEEMKHEVQLVAESVVQLTAEVRREDASIRTEMRRGFAETHALIRFTYSELGRSRRRK